MFTLLAHSPSSDGLDVLLQGRSVSEDRWASVPRVHPHQIVRHPDCTCHIRQSAKRVNAQPMNELMPSSNNQFPQPRPNHSKVLQVGQQTQRVTNDAFRATVHRVRKVPSCHGRLALIAFFRLGLSTSLAVPASLRCVKNDAGGVYPPCTVEDFMSMARTDSEGNAVKLTSIILKGANILKQRGFQHPAVTYFIFPSCDSFDSLRTDVDSHRTSDGRWVGARPGSHRIPNIPSESPKALTQA